MTSRHAWLLKAGDGAGQDKAAVQEQQGSENIRITSKQLHVASSGEAHLPTRILRVAATSLEELSCRRDRLNSKLDGVPEFGSAWLAQRHSSAE